MGARRLAIVVDAADPELLREFWVAATGYEPYGSAGPYRSAVPPDGEDGPKLVFQRVPEPRADAKNRLHLDIVVGDRILEEADRLETLGARRHGELIEEVGTSWLVMADPEGNEFCLVEQT